MYEYNHSFSEKLRWFAVVLLAIVAGLFATALATPAQEVGVSAVSATTVTHEEYTMSTYDSPNAVSNGMAEAADALSQAIDTTEYRLNRTGGSLVAAVSSSGSVVGGGLQAGAGFIGNGIGATARFAGACVGNTARFIGNGVSNTARFLTRAASSSIAFIVKAPGNILGFAADAPIVSAITQPAGSAAAPTIGPATPLAIAGHTALPAAVAVNQPKPAAGVADAAAAWPLHGEITTLFGVPHWPYQPTHTGIDISDGRPAGVSPIKPFKPGRVVDTVHSYRGLGNHVIVDHGNGLTSLYGHLASISVEVGQTVDMNTTLGFEGSTGASTGTHLHLEIRQHGQVVDPLRYIGGRP